MAQSPPIRASVIVDNYNYEHYVGQAIDSALSQTYDRLEVIVVDDGSVDGSAQAIEGFGERVTAILKSNGGQASAFNAAFERAGGEVIVFLDADDLLLPDAVANAVAAMEPDVAMVHWPLWEIDRDGERTGGVVDPDLPEGDFREIVRRLGPGVEDVWPNAATSGNAWSRKFLEQVMPMPHVFTGTDIYLSGLAGAFGRVVTLPEPQSLYRVHGANLSGELSFARMMELGCSLFEEQSRALAAIYRRAGVDFDASVWPEHAWYPRIQTSLRELERLLEPGEAFVLVDETKWGVENEFAGHPVIPFPEHDGQWDGWPENDQELIAQLNRANAQGVRLIVFAWPAFWWLDEYPELAAYLGQHSQQVLSNEHMRVFALVSRAEAATSRSSS
jgi:glycosyltransferase involved in cell wall biosynthesis